MEKLLIQIFDILVTSPGNLVYHLILIFSVMAAIQVLTAHIRDYDSSIFRRKITGLIILLLLQISLFVASSLMWVGIGNAQALLPILDRAVTTASFLWIGWLWLFDKPNRLADTIVVLLSIGIVIIYVFGTTFLSTRGEIQSFNYSPFDIFWTIFQIVLASLAIAIFYFSRLESSGIGLGSLVILLLGGLLHFLVDISGNNFSGATRLALLCAFPLLPSLTHSIPHRRAGVNDKDLSSNTTSKVEGIGQKRSALQAWASLSNTDVISKKIDGITSAIAYSLPSDLTLLLSQTADSKKVILRSGYDLNKSKKIPPMEFWVDEIPNFITALRQNQSMRISAQGASYQADLQALATWLGLNSCGPIITAPLKIPDAEWSEILVLAPYSQREWLTEELDLLDELAQLSDKILWEKLTKPKSASQADYLTLSALQKAEAELETLRSDQRLLLQELSSLRSDKPVPLGETDVESLLAIQREAQDTIQRLETDNMSLREMLTAAQNQQDSKDQSKIQTLELQLKQTLNETARLQNILAEANITIQNLQRTTSSTGHSSHESGEVLLGLVQELRQPVSSIIGYSDLLELELVQVDTFQENVYLNRIKESAERMKVLVNDLYQISSAINNPIELVSQKVDIEPILDQVINDISTLLQEKSINLQLDIVEDLPGLFADRDAFRQIMMHLLQNACLATPQGGNIRLGVFSETGEKGESYIHCLVTDQGGGIPTDSISKIFSHRYRTENQSIPGVGDVVGLSISKTLVEAHGGRIWLESTPGFSSTFSILLPLLNGQISNLPKEA